MPRVFKIGGYLIYFWSNEGRPLEPIHFHITEGNPSANATKVWITQSGKCLLAHNQSKIPTKILRNIMAIVEARSDELIEKWYAYFNEVSYYC